MDFKPDISEALEALIDRGLVAERSKQKPRDYLGGSRLGEECERKLFYEYTNTPKDQGRGFTGRTYRIFDMGHDSEKRMAEYLRLAGFDLRTHKEDGNQFGFAICRDPETGQARIAGHIDGALVSGPNFIDYPCLWESKALGSKPWASAKKQGIQKSHPVYYAQIAMYQAYMGLTEYPALFTAINRDTGAIHPELVPFDKAEAQKSSDRGVKVISVGDISEIPRIARERSFFKCKWCDFQDRCWQYDTAPGDGKQVADTPSWFVGMG